MSGLIDSTLDAVGQVGGAFDKVTGGRALRGVLAGKPRELASFVPFSDEMGLTKKSDATSGRDLTDAYGVTNKGDHSFGANAAGFLADTAASPLSLLGGYGAFKAAPTLAKGISAGAKAVTGLDALEHAGSAVKGFAGKLSRHVEMPDGSLIRAFGTVASDDQIRHAAYPHGGFFGGDDGAFRGPRVQAKPVDVDALHAESLSANATRPRRWSAVPAQKSYYSADRGRRYAERMSGKEIPNPAAGPSEIPQFTLSDAIKRFASSESGSLNVNAFAGRKPAAQIAAASNPARQTVDKAVSNLADRFGSSGSLHGRDSKDFAASFIDKPTFPPTPEGIEAANKFQGTLEAGTTAANTYFSPLYYDINKHLRDMGPLASREVEAIRGGHYRGPVGAPTTKPPLAPLMPYQQNNLDQFYHQFGYSPTADLTSLDEARKAKLEAGIKEFFGPNADLYSPHVFAKKAASQVHGFTPDHAKVTSFVDGMGLSGPKSAAMHFDGKGLAPISDEDLANAFGHQWPDYKAHFQELAGKQATLNKLHQPPDSLYGTPYEHPNPGGLSPDLTHFGDTPLKSYEELMAMDDSEPLSLMPAQQGHSHQPGPVPASAPSPYAGKSSGELFQAMDDAALYGDQATYDAIKSHIDGEITNEIASNQKAPKVHGSSAHSENDALSDDAFWGLVKKNNDQKAATKPMDKASLMQAIDAATQANDHEAYGGLVKQWEDSYGATAKAKAFSPDQSLVDAYTAKHGMDPYEHMGEVHSAYWKDHMHDAFGDQSYDTIKFYNDMAKADGTHSGLADGLDEIPFGGFMADTPTVHPAPATQNGVPYAPGVVPSRIPAHNVPRVRDTIDGLMGLFDHSRMPNDMELYRGIDGKGLRTVEQQLGVNLRSPDAVGKEILDPAFLSTAFHKPTADQFAGLEAGYNRPDPGVTFTFPNVPKGKTASMMNGSENEILFPPGRRIKITDNSNYPHLKAELYGTLLAALMGGGAANHYREQ